MDKSTNFEVKELLVRFRGGDDSAFSVLVERYTPMMRKEISSFFGNSATADELFCEACVALHSAAMSYNLDQTEVTFGLYAGICVRRRLIDMTRGNKLAFGDIDSVRYDTFDDGLVGEIVNREMFDLVMSRAKELLTECEYRVLILHIQGYKTAAIAKALDKTPKSVDNAKFRLFRRLRSALGGISEI